MNNHSLNWTIEEIWNFSKINNYLFNHSQIKSNIYFNQKNDKSNDIRSKYLHLRKK